MRSLIGISYTRTALALALFLVPGTPNNFAQEAGDAIKYWVFFKDKTAAERTHVEAMKSSRSLISSRALKRRAKVRASQELWDEHDNPVSNAYLSNLESLGFEPVVISNWLNAATFFLSSEEFTQVKELPFVTKIQPVARVVRRPEPSETATGAPRFGTLDSYSFNYGLSFQQNHLLNIPAVHQLGITGVNVIIGLLDTGFKVRNHDAFQQLEVLAEYDFINNDNFTENEIGQDHPNQHAHGTQTLSVIAGFQEGQLIGTAFEAKFLLAKTEDLINEVRQEEDHWVAGLEWLENMGADIVSSSVGYLDFYEPAQMDGRTAVTTIAADLAVSRGMVVVNSAGNEGNNDWGIIISPADGNHVIAVGAVNYEGDLASFSSVGPSADGRIKPDVVAMGSGVATAFPASEKNTSTFGFVSGTSFSAPAVAGVAALILSAHPNLTPFEVRDALRLTADRAQNPDNQYGWGLVNAYEAIRFHGTAFSNQPQVSVNINGNPEISIHVVSKAGIDPNAVQIVYALSDLNFSGHQEMSQVSQTSEFVASLPVIASANRVHFYFTSVDSNGTTAVQPASAPDSFFTFTTLPVAVRPPTEPLPKSFFLGQNYPNPFNPSTQIDFTLPKSSDVILTIYNVLGQKVRILLEGQSNPAGIYNVTWDGKDDFGQMAPSGIYFYRMQAQRFSSVRKMLLLN